MLFDRCANYRELKIVFSVCFVALEITRASTSLAKHKQKHACSHATSQTERGEKETITHLSSEVMQHYITVQSEFQQAVWLMGGQQIVWADSRYKCFKSNHPSPPTRKQVAIGNTSEMPVTNVITIIGIAQHNNELLLASARSPIPQKSCLERV